MSDREILLRHWLLEPFGSDLEEILCCRLANRCLDDVRARNQVWVDCGDAGRYRVDLMLTRYHKGTLESYVIEVDGKQYHDAAKDRVRDAALRRNGITRVVHVPAWKVWHHCDDATDEVIGMLWFLFRGGSDLYGFNADWDYNVAENHGEDMATWWEKNRANQ